jgi:hypothetical protein
MKTSLLSLVLFVTFAAGTSAKAGDSCLDRFFFDHPSESIVALGAEASAQIFSKAGLANLAFDPMNDLIYWSNASMLCCATLVTEFEKHPRPQAGTEACAVVLDASGAFAPIQYSILK